MTEEVRAAAYLVLCLFEETINLANEKDFNAICNLPSIRKLNGRKELREIRNILVHHPFDYIRLYKYFNKHKPVLVSALLDCVSKTGKFTVNEAVNAVNVLLKFYKANK